MAVVAADTAWPCSPTLLVMPPGLPTKVSKRCFTHPTPESWVCIPFLTPPPIEVAPKPILYDQSEHPPLSRTLRLGGVSWKSMGTRTARADAGEAVIRR